MKQVDIISLLDHETVEKLAVEADRVLDIRDLEARLPFSANTIRRMIRERRIPAVHLNGKWVISRAEYVRVRDEGFPLPSGSVRKAS